MRSSGAAGVPRLKAQVICVGNSLVRGDQGTPYPTALAGLLGASVLHVLNLGINGESTSQLISADFATQKNNISPGLRNVVVLWEATNDIWFNYVTTGAAALATMQALAALWRAAGCKVIVMDVIARGNFSDAQRAASVSYNALLSAGWASFADGFVELSGAFADYSDLSLYTSDTIHLNTTGYALVASLAQPTVSAVLSTWPAY